MKIKSFSFYYHLIIALVSYIQIAFPKLIGFPIVTFFVLIIVGLLNRNLKFQFSKITFILSLFYFTYFIGFFFTSNLDIAQHCLESKASFFLFPLFFSFRLQSIFNLKWAFYPLIIGILQASLVGVINSIGCDVIRYGCFGCITSSNISPIHHPSYYSSFILFTLVFIWHGFVYSWNSFKLHWIIIISIYLMVFYFLCLSLASFLFLFLFLLFIILKYLKWTIYRVFLLICFILLTILFFSFNKEFNKAKTSFLNYSNNPIEYVISKKGDLNGNEIRLILWTVSFERILKQPLGVGTGNVDDAMNQQLVKYGRKDLLKLNLNPHNQFLQTALEVGVLGLFILILFITLVIIQAIKTNNFILLTLMFIFVFNSLFESMLQRQSGIVFYSFWICLLLAYDNINNIKRLHKFKQLAVHVK